MRKKDISFAKSFEELEKIAAWFESGEADVEEGLKKFEEGMELAKLCKERLAAVENKVIEIKKKFAESEPVEKNLEIDL
jgi:exodeoxyribonuclease VII small subunit